MEIRIESGIPIPKERPQFKSHIEKMEIGDSFRVHVEHWTSLRNAASNMNKRTAKKFVVQKVKEPINPDRKTGEKIEFVRIWRKF